MMSSDTCTASNARLTLLALNYRQVIESIGSALTKGGLGKGERVLLNFVYPSAWIVSVPQVF